MKQKPVNIKVKFGSAVVKLKDHESRVKTTEGVVIWIKPRAGSCYQAMAEIPDGTLDKYMHCHAKIISCDWVPA